MRIDGILDPELVQQGFTLDEDEDFVCLKHKGELVARFYSSAIMKWEIKQLARVWLKEHKEV